ncbi:unnamed protein product [Cyclocybe aegerita]|uniref:BTB domain-containing protein n=1 Tax=Cyclocybe aegerita TaxID=1973307 RepID=A0A8S0WWD6_CYCAE|nr:unnamed protein product [Cyclocybe aegerita]
MSAVNDNLREVPVASTVINGEPAEKGKQREEPLVEDEEYFLQSSFVYFQVENHLFHIPSYRFTMESHVFAGMFRLPQSNVFDVEGASRGNPIVLPIGISHVDFRNFLKALYPLPVEIRLSLSKEEWLSVLKLSSFWYFLGFRKMAIAELANTKALTATEKITWGRDVKVSKEEALTIGYETTFSLFRLREERLSSRIPSVVDSIRAEFKAELEGIRAEEKGYSTEEDSEDINFEKNDEKSEQERAAKVNVKETPNGPGIFGSSSIFSPSAFAASVTASPVFPSTVFPTSAGTGTKKKAGRGQVAY